MTGTSRLPAGEPRKASQRRTRPAVGGHARIILQWRMGDRVRWQDKMGHFHRDLGDGNAEATIAKCLSRQDWGSEGQMRSAGGNQRQGVAAGGIPAATSTSSS